MRRRADESINPAGEGEGAKDVPDDPEVVASVPAAPEAGCRVVVRHASDHVFGWVDAVQETPEAEESPRNQEL
mgnify:CR=1 FL=1